MREHAERSVALVRERLGDFEPKLGIILGSGLDAVADGVTEAKSVPYTELQGFPQPTVEGHSGALVVGRLGGVATAVLRGRSHVYESGRSDAMRVPLETLRRLGCETLLLTNAAGSLMPYAAPGSLALVTDHIGIGLPNPLMGEVSATRFLDMVDAYDPSIRRTLGAAAHRLGIHLHQGVYMWFGGPSFETPAEIRAAKNFGADLVGMSTVPEVIIARFLGYRVAAISVVTNFAAGLAEDPLSHEHTVQVAGVAAKHLTRLLEESVEQIVQKGR